MVRQEEAEVLAAKALGWIAGSDDLLPIFLGSTGASVGDLRARAAEPEFLMAVLDFLMLDDAWVLAFAGSEGLAPEILVAAKAALPGGAQTHWT